MKKPKSYFSNAFLVGKANDFSKTNWGDEKFTVYSNQLKLNVLSKREDFNSKYSEKQFLFKTMVKSSDDGRYLNFTLFDDMELPNGNVIKNISKSKGDQKAGVIGFAKVISQNENEIIVDSNKSDKYTNKIYLNISNIDNNTDDLVGCEIYFKGIIESDTAETNDFGEPCFGKNEIFVKEMTVFEKEKEKEEEKIDETDVPF